MFRPVPMVHLQVQVPSRDGAAVTRCIAAQGLLHLIDIGHGATASRVPSATLESLARVRELAHSVRQIAAALDVPLADLGGAVTGDEIADFDAEYADLHERFAPIRATADEARQRAASAADAGQRARVELDRIRRLDAAGVDVARVRALSFSALRIGATSSADLNAIADQLAPAAFAIVPLGPAGPRQLAAVAVPASNREALDKAIRLTTFEPVDPAEDGRDAATVTAQIETAAAAEAAAVTDLRTLRDSAAETIRAIARRADLAVVLLQAQTLFAAAGRFLVVSGWIPEDRAPELSATIARVTEGRAVIAVDRPDQLPAASLAAMGVPILYRNPLLLKPFQRLVDLYGIPSYPEVQPTAFFAISFLLMFGLMFGDAGHGAVLVAAGYCLFRYIPRFLDYGVLLMEAGTASMAFGILYGSVFGVERWLPALWLHPIRDITRFTWIAAGFGFVMISAGFVLGVVNTWRSGDRAGALVSVRGLFGACAYWTCMAVAARLLLPVTWTVPDAAIVVLLIAAAALLLMRPLIVKALAPAGEPARPPDGVTPRWLGALEGSVELIDAIVSYFANTVSFVRVAAFAAVHAAVLVAVFAIADTIAQYRFGSWLSIAVLVGGNVLTILLEGLTVTVQALRLEYYEFFGRFFRGGGEPYRPLMLRPNGARGDA